jgi:hypothetical protein
MVFADVGLDLALVCGPALRALSRRNQLEGSSCWRMGGIGDALAFRVSFFLIIREGVLLFFFLANERSF